MSQLKNDLSGLKSKLENIEGEFESKLKEVENKEQRFQKIDQQIEDLVAKKDSIVKLNVGGKVFQTKISTLTSVKDSLFSKIISVSLENNEPITELFFDRSFLHFHIILDFLRTKKFDHKGLSKYDIDDIKAECEYYGISSFDDILMELQKEVEFVSFESSGQYSTAGTQRVEDLKDSSLMKGICVQSPYYITITLNFEHEFESIDIGGWNGNNSLWYPGNGSGSQILTSVDNSKWTEVGKIPSDFGGKIQTVSLKRSVAKYIKFQHNSYVGLGYLKIHRYNSK